MPYHRLPGIKDGVAARGRAVDFDLAALDAGRPFIFTGVQARGGEIGQHGLPRGFTADLFPV